MAKHYWSLWARNKTFWSFWAVAFTAIGYGLSWCFDYYFWYPN